MKAALDWFRSTGSDTENLEWLLAMKAAGHRVKLLENQPQVDIYEMLIIRSRALGSVSDIIDYGILKGVYDIEEFVDLVLYCKQQKE